jgi:hypothetical protein
MNNGRNNNNSRKSACSLEHHKLSFKESDWKLPGMDSINAAPSRTRGGGLGRPNLKRVLPFEEDTTSESDAETPEASAAAVDFEDLPEEEEEESEEEDEPKQKPPSTHVIVETKALTDLIVSHCRCMQRLWRSCEG